MADLTPKQQAILDRWQAILNAATEPPADDTYIGDPSSAHHFYHYHGGTAIRMACPAGMIFDPTVTSGPRWNPPLVVSLDANPAPRR